MTKIKIKILTIALLAFLMISSLVIGGITVSEQLDNKVKAESKILFEHDTSGAIAVCDDIDALPAEVISEETQYSMQILFNYEPYSDDMYKKNHTKDETFVEYSKKYHTGNNKNYLSQINTEKYDVFVSEYTPYIFLECLDDSTVENVYNDAVKIAKNSNVSEVRIYSTDMYDTQPDFLEVVKEFDEPFHKEDIQTELTADERLATTASSDSRSSAYENFPTETPYTGRGIKIGLFDSGFFDTSHSNFANITKRVVFDETTTNDSDLHPTIVASVLGGKYGYASGASIYYVDYQSDPSLTGIERLINEGCHIVNMSFILYGTTDNTYNTGLEGYLDYIYTSTKIIMVAGSGNDLNKSDRAGYISIPALCANVISVGSVTNAPIPVPSEFSNYKTKNDVTSNPNLVAVGTQRNVSGFGIRDGTSLSAPAITGAIALYFERYGVYELPEVLAVLSATANRNVSTQAVNILGTNHTNNLKTNGSRERTGAGVLDVTYLLMCNTFLCNSSMTFTSSNYVTIGNVYIGAGYTAQIALAWERAATRTVEGALWWQTVTYASSPLANFDLYLFDSNGSSVGIGWSSSSNVEIIEFTASTTGFYTVKIKPQSNYTGTHNINCVSLVK